MAWICPTFQRPEKLANLAESWYKNAEGIQLFVRVWKQDPKREEYYKREWPPEFIFYESDAEWAGEALSEYFHGFPDDEHYGFIGDDITLETFGGIEELVVTAGAWFIAYPNDTIQRHHLCTHFCIGGELIRTLGFLVPPGMRHHYIDNVLHTVGLNTGLLRYCPHIIFRHNHFLRGREYDATYQRVYNADGSMLESAERRGKAQFDLWMNSRAKSDILRVRRKMAEVFEGKLYTDEEVEDARKKLGF